MSSKGRPKKAHGTAYDNRRNVRLPDRYAEMLQEIAAHKGVPAETLLRSFALDGIRREYPTVKSDTTIFTA
jgi:hypothetical protein